MREEQGLRRCIISLATADKRYPKGLARLQASARRSGFAGELLIWPPGRFPTGCPAHRDVPFAFKPYCFREARAQGMDLVLWLDSSCVVIRPLDDIFRQMAERGYILFGNRSYKLGEWASDAALAHLSMSRDDAMHVPEINGAAMGLNLESEIATEFLERWYEEARDGTSFRGVGDAPRSSNDSWAIKWNRSGRASADPRVRGHRHDQTVAGILAHRLGMEITTEGLESSPREGDASARAMIAIDRDFTRTVFDRFVLGQLGRSLRRRLVNLRYLQLSSRGPRSR